MPTQIPQKRNVAPEETQEIRDKARNEILRRNPHLSEKPDELRRAVDEEMDRMKDKHGDIR